jgi:hypothetical protein
LSPIELASSGITERPRPTLSVPVKVALKRKLGSPAAALSSTSK